MSRFRSFLKYQQFFGASPQATEIEYHFQTDRLDVSDGNRRLIGTAELKAAKTSPTLTAIQVYLPPEQKVLLFMSHGDSFQSRVYAVALRKVQNRTGIYKSVDGNIERPIFVTLPSDANEGSFMGVFDGELIPDLLDYQLAPVQ